MQKLIRFIGKLDRWFVVDDKHVIRKSFINGKQEEFKVEYDTNYKYKEIALELFTKEAQATYKDLKVVNFMYKVQVTKGEDTLTFRDNEIVENYIPCIIKINKLYNKTWIDPWTKAEQENKKKIEEEKKEENERIRIIAKNMAYDIIQKEKEKTLMYKIKKFIKYQCKRLQDRIYYYKNKNGKYSCKKKMKELYVY